MDRALAEAVRQQSDDLRDALKDLETWEEKVGGLESRKSSAASQPLLPPVRGTVPSLKKALDEARDAASASGVREDPVLVAKDKGNAMFKEGKFSEALRYYTEGIDVDPDNGERQYVLYANRAMCYLKMNDWANAEWDATRCIQMNRTYAKGFFRRAIARKNLSRLAEARSDLESVLALAPGDSQAKAELQQVMELLRKEQAKVGEQTRSNAAATDQQNGVRKRVIITEVEDEDDDEDVNASMPSAPAVSEEEAKKFEAENERIESLRRTMREEQAQKAKAKFEAMERRIRKSDRVEVIDDAPMQDAKSQHVVNERHADPTSLGHDAEAESAPPAAAPATGKKAGLGMSDSKKAEVIQPRILPSVRVWSKETLTAPKTYSEFERVFQEISGDKVLADHYASLLDPSSLPGLFGSSLSPELLVGLLGCAARLPGPSARGLLRGLSEVRRVGDLVLFFNESESGVLREAFEHVSTNGDAPATELARLRLAFQV